MPNLDPSDVLRAAMHRYRDDLAKVAGQAPLWRCHCCKSWIPRKEFPMRCDECSGPVLKGVKVGYRFKAVRQDAMICIRCVDNHFHLREQIQDMMLKVYEDGKERHRSRAVMLQ